jgi:hypothetical protein
MNWRTLLSSLLVLLLLLPLAWLLSIALSGHGPSLLLPQGKALVPMLSHEERLRLRTYDYECRTDADCESPLRCFYNPRTERQACADSTCMADSDCPGGFACRSFPCHTLEARNGKDLVRICSPLGVRKEGERCASLPATRDEGCERGLLCQGFCGRPCRLDEPSSCPEGYFCREGNNGPSCLPTCEGRSCPEDQRCLPFSAEKASVCTKVHGQDCEQNPCPQGAQCTRYAYPTHPGEAWMECLRPCSEGEPLCAEGSVCYLYRCRKSCDPEAASACGPGFACKSRPGEPWTCVPDTHPG